MFQPPAKVGRGRVETSVLRWSRQMIQRRAALFLGIILASLPVAAQRPVAKTEALFAQINELTATLSEITGWPVRRRVPAEVISKAKFQSYLQSHTRSKSNQKEIRAEETALKMFGLVPADFNLARETEDLLGEQAAAYYDYKKKRLYVLDSTPEGDESRMALVHELAHALADQQHPLGTYLDANSIDSDASTAREAVMEGQATWLTWAYEAKRAGMKAEVPAGRINQLTQPQEATPEFPVLSATPLYMRESLLFPYNAGARFQDAVYRSMGKSAFETVFARGPKSTHQILHPEEYVERKEFAAPKAPSYEMWLGKLAHQMDGQIESTLGEFDYAVLLRQYIGEPDANLVASRLHGSGFRLYQHKKEKYSVLAHWSEWESPAAARAYFDGYQRVLKGKWKRFTVASSTKNGVRGEGDSGKFVLRIDGARVQCLEGLR